MDIDKIFKIEDFYIFGTVILALLVIYFIVSSSIKKSNRNNDHIRRSISNLRSSFLLIFIACFFILWAKELFQFILSIAAIGAALAIAMKEVFICFGGSFYRTFSQPFSVGDRIQIGEIRGDVVDVGFMGTQILEVGPKDYTQQFTGRTISIPNSLFLTSTIYNETAQIHDDDEEFCLHVFRVPVENNETWEFHRTALLKAAQNVCNKYIEEANHYFKKVAKKRHVDIPWIEPRINIRIQTSKVIDYYVRVTVPVSLKGIAEQQILRQYLDTIHKKKISA